MLPRLGYAVMFGVALCLIVLATACSSAHFLPADTNMSSQIAQSIIIMAPSGDGQTLASPIHVNAGTMWGSVQSMAVIVDGAVAQQASGNAVEMDVPLEVGHHLVTIQVTDTAGQSGHKSFSVVVPGARFAYVPNCLSSSISVFAVEPHAGTLSTQGLVNTMAATCPAAVALNPAASFLFVANQSGCSDMPGISAYSVEPSTGNLSEVAGSPFTGFNPFALAVHPSGNFVYAVDPCSASVVGFRVDAHGALSAISAATQYTGQDPAQVVISRDGKFVYVAAYSSNQVFGFSVDQATGALAALSSSPFDAGQGPFALTTEYSGHFLYATNIGSGDISAYSIDRGSGNLTPVAGSPFTAGKTPMSIASSSKFLYVSDSGSEKISSFTIDPQTGALAATPAAGFNASPGSALVVEPSGHYLFVSTFHRSNLRSVMIDQHTGELTLSSTVKTLGGSWSVAVSAN